VGISQLSVTRQVTGPLGADAGDLTQGFLLNTATYNTYIIATRACSFEIRYSTYNNGQLQFEGSGAAGKFYFAFRQDCPPILTNNQALPAAASSLISFPTLSAHASISSQFLSSPHFVFSLGAQHVKIIPKKHPRSCL
jgi:hypothetical protein